MDSYESFYRENKNRIFHYLLRMTGDYHRSFDFMQESFTRYFSRYRFNGHNSALLYTIARNTALDSSRKHREENLNADDEESLLRDPERQLIEKQAVNKTIDAIQKLSPVDRELIALLATRKFSYKEIGQQLNINEANVKVKVHRARLRLKAILGKEGQ